MLCLPSAIQMVCAAAVAPTAACTAGAHMHAIAAIPCAARGCVTAGLLPFSRASPSWSASSFAHPAPAAGALPPPAHTAPAPQPPPRSPRPDYRPLGQQCDTSPHRMPCLVRSEAIRPRHTRRMRCGPSELAVRRPVLC